MNADVKSAVRTLEMLEFLGAAPEPVSLKDMVAALGYPKSSAHALAQTLVGRGYVMQDGERYVIADHAREGFAGRSRQERLLRLARPIMDDLRRQIGETVLLGVRTPRGDVRMIAKSVSDNPVRFDKNLERTSAAYCTATGRVLLAFWDEASREAYLARTPLLPHTPRTVTDVEELRAILRRVRRSGVAVSEEEHVLGSTGVAAPVFDRTGQALAALDIGAISARFAAARRMMTAAVQDVAAALSRKLGQV